MPKPSEEKSLKGKLVASDKLTLPKFEDKVLRIEKGLYLQPPIEKEI